MKSRSARFDAVMRSRVHDIVTRVDVLYNRQRINLPGSSGRGLRTVQGFVELDRTRANMGSLSASFAEPELAPTPEQPGILTPFGYELQAWRGLRYSDGTTELISLGVFPIQTSKFNVRDLAAGITALDRSQLVRDARLEDVYTIAAGTNLATAIRDLISAGVPGLEFDFATTSQTVPFTVWPAMSDRWDRARELATNAGMELFFGGTGRCVLRPEPGLGAAPVWQFVEGDLLIDADVEYDRRKAYSKVICTGSNTALGVFRGEAIDSNPQSPTYYYGGFGRKPMWYSSPLFTSNDQCTVSAKAMMAAKSGIARSVRAVGVPHPCLEPGDITSVIKLPMVAELYAWDAVRYGLTARDDARMAA